MFLNEKLYEFDLAFSYASEDEYTVHKLKDYLREKTNLRIYDYQENKKLSIFEYTPEVLKKIYSNKKVIMIMFLSENYIKKDFTNFESQFACQHLMQDKRLIVIKLDKSTNAWLPDMKDYISLYGNKKNDVREITKVGDLILDALNLYKEESIESLYELIKNEITQKLPFYEINFSNLGINISNNKNQLIIYMESNSLYLSEKFSSTDVNPMPFIKIILRDNEYIMICTIPQIMNCAHEKLSKETALKKLCEVINEIIKL